VFGQSQTPSTKGDAQGKACGLKSNTVELKCEPNTNKMLGEIDKYDPGCKGAYRDAAEKITSLSDDQWDQWLKQTVRAAAGE
jgi:hypothetical protein